LWYASGDGTPTPRRSADGDAAFAPPAGYHRKRNAGSEEGSRIRASWALAGLFAVVFAPVTGVGSAAPYFSAEFIYLQDPGFPNCHCSSLLQLQNGDLLCAWYGYTGSENGTACEVRYSRKAAGSSAWTRPRTVIWDPLPNGDRTQGNCVLWQDPDGKVWCFYDVRTAVEWSTTLLKYATSTDNGHTWSPPVTLTSELGNNVRCHAFVASSGAWILPAYSDVDNTGVMFISTDQGVTWRKSAPLGNPRDPAVIQPSVIERSDHSLRALLRKCGAPLNIHESYSYDSGWTWTHPAPISLPNPECSVEQMKLANGHVVLIFNNTTSGRTPLSAALSTDGGATWIAVRNLETAAGEYSYPSIIQTADGLLHVTYTHRREHIKHVVFNEDWLAAGAAAFTD
jgi:predicted neuraminidase